MKLYYSATSPFVRKVLLSAHEKGFYESIEFLSEGGVGRDNPLAKVPALVVSEREVIIDSFVICDYFESFQPNPTLIPTDSCRRNHVLRLHALGDGIMESAVASVMEGRRPKDKQWQDFHSAQHAKINNALVAIESQVHNFVEMVDLGTLTVAAALGYLDLRFSDWDWSARCPELAGWYARFCDRPSMRATRPTG